MATVLLSLSPQHIVEWLSTGLPALPPHLASTGHMRGSGMQGHGSALPQYVAVFSWDHRMEDSKLVVWDLYTSTMVRAGTVYLQVLASWMAQLLA